MDTFNPPPITLPENIQEILTRYSSEIAAWKKLLIDLGFKVVIVGDPMWGHGFDDGLQYHRDIEDHNPIWGTYSMLEAVKEGMIVCGASYACGLQFITDSQLPDGNESENCIEVAFGMNDTAFIQLTYYDGILLFDKSKYFPNKDYPTKRINGTHKEIAERLLSLRKEMAENLSLGDPPKQEA